MEILCVNIENWDSKIMNSFEEAEKYANEHKEISQIIYREEKDMPYRVYWQKQNIN